MLSKKLLSMLVGSALVASSAYGQLHPYAQDVADQTAALKSSTPTVRAAAAEALGHLRAHGAADALVTAMKDDDAAVRREAAMALAWCGARKHVAPLLAALDDADWTVRQTAHVALENLTGMELPFDALAATDIRAGQAKRWRTWWADVAPGQIPKELAAALKQMVQGGNLARGCTVTVSGTYKGPPSVLTDGRRGGFWQTKNVPFPQWCTVDLGRVQTVARVVVRQYDQGFCMTKWEVSAGVDGKTFETVQRGQRLSPVDLTVSFAPRKARYIRITSHATERSIYPTTFREVEVYASKGKPETASREQTLEAKLRAVRALGSLGGEGAPGLLAATVEPYRDTGATPSIEREIVRAALRSLGRLRDPATLKLLTDLLDNPLWARYAADALGVFADDTAAAALIAAYPPYARSVTGKAPKRLPRDDHPGLTPDDRMYETPFAIASALSVLPLRGDKDIAALREIAPVLAANVPQDHDGAMLYEPEANRRVTAWLLERAGMRQAVCEAAFVALGQPRRGEAVETDAMAALAKRMNAKAQFAAAYLPALCTDKRDVPRLIALLAHKDGWARINAAKALMFLNERSAVGTIAKLLAASKAEADFGFFGRFMFGSKGKQGQDEYDDPPPRWREAFVRALGRLGGADHVPLLAKLLRDERSALEIQAAAAVALDELGTPDALAALQAVEPDHPYHSIRLIAREALWRRGLISSDASPPPPAAAKSPPPEATASTSEPEAVVFIRGDNKMPNRFQIDAWRQTYSTTDSGPTYRLGRNLCVLRPARPGGTVTPLTDFSDGYVADCEVSWDGRKVIFARRGGDTDPWWHLWEVGVDGTGLRQITKGPYHDVQPAWLGDGRIVLSTTRIGLRDEYHGYLATGLAVMNADGSGLQCIGFNLGRDNEPSVLPDGRILFSRLDLFYSRLKTELTVQAIAPDGTRNVTLYGPERRDFWRQVTRTSGEKGWGEVPPRHRVLRLTQPQPLPDGRILCASTGGLVAVGPSRYEEQFLPHDKSYAVTSPFPLPDGRILCAAAKKKGPVDLGLYTMDAKTGKLTPLYNDPTTAEFEPRPVLARPRPPAAAEAPVSRAYTARLFCNSATVSREPEPARRGCLVRIIEGQPIFGRHATHRSPVPGWKNHTGTHARILGTVPLAADGSFFLEVPADRLVHLQVLDADRQVVGNQLVWMYARPGETRSCVGCHEYPDSTAPRRPLRQAAAVRPVPCLPTGGEFSYRAKVWNKGTLTDEAERRTRTVHAVNLLARP